MVSLLPYAQTLVCITVGQGHDRSSAVKIRTVWKVTVNSAYGFRTILMQTFRTQLSLGIFLKEKSANAMAGSAARVTCKKKQKFCARPDSSTNEGVDRPKAGEEEEEEEKGLCRRPPLPGSPPGIRRRRRRPLTTRRPSRSHRDASRTASCL